MTAYQAITNAKPSHLQIDLLDLETIVQGELSTLRKSIADLASLGSHEATALLSKFDEAQDLIVWQVSNLAQSLAALQIGADAEEVRHD